jgi:hypothetical protein
METVPCAKAEAASAVMVMIPSSFFIVLVFNVVDVCLDDS